MERASLFIKDNIRLLLGAIVVVFVTVLLITLFVSKKSTKVIIGNQTFRVMVAKTDKEKQIGLSNKKQIAKDQGMLFIFDNSDLYSFWMKNMEFPIDIIYINGNKVTTVISNAKVPSSNTNLMIYQPEDKSDKVLEISAGLSNKYNIKKGSTVTIENL